MSAILRLSLTLTLIAVGFVVSVSAQVTSDSAVVQLPGGGFAVFRLGLESVGSNDRNWISVSHRVEIDDASGVLHRTLLDERNNIIFAYDVIITFDKVTHQFTVSPRPVTVESQSKSSRNPSSVRTIPRSIASQVIRDGQTLAMDLLVNEAKLIKVVDYITVATERQRLIKSEPSDPRDFTLGNVELAVADTTLRINDQKIVTSSSKRNCRGPLIWVYIPGRGRFIFSLVPYPGYDFKKVAVVNERVISFRWNNDNYEWVSSRPILAGAGNWNLWVLHDGDFVDLFAPPEPNPVTTQSRPSVFEKPWSINVQLEGPKVYKHSSHSDLPAPEPVTMRVLVGGSQSMNLLMPGH